MSRAATVLTLTGVVALLGAAACVSLAGLSGDQSGPEQPDAAADATPGADASPPDPCRHSLAPPEPAADDDTTTEVPPFVLAVREVSVKGAIDGGAPIGFDLDDTCSCFGDPTTAHGGQPSCAPRDGGSATCDGDGGTDNALGGLLAAYPEFLAGSAATGGGASLLIKIAKYNGRANDREVFIAIVASPGIYDSSGCGDAGAAGMGPYSATWRGCDRWAVDPNYVLPGTTEPAAFGSAYVADHVLVLRPSAKPTAFLVGNTAFPLTGTRVAARLVAVDDAMVPIVPAPAVGTRFRLEEGVLSGRAATADLLRAFAASQARSNGGPLCGTPNFYDAVKAQFVCPGADVMSATNKDFTQATCDAVSLATAFNAWPARIGDVRALDPTPCGDPLDPAFKELFECP